MARELKMSVTCCGNCPHLDHSGAFTPGGSKPICGNYYALSEEKRKRWENRVVDVKTIPDWCPLPQAGGQ